MLGPARDRNRSGAADSARGWIPVLGVPVRGAPVPGPVPFRALLTGSGPGRGNPDRPGRVETGWCEDVVYEVHLQPLAAHVRRGWERERAELPVERLRPCDLAFCPVATLTVPGPGRPDASSALCATPTRSVAGRPPRGPPAPASRRMPGGWGRERGGYLQRVRGLRRRGTRGSSPGISRTPSASTSTGALYLRSFYSFPSPGGRRPTNSCAGCGATRTRRAHGTGLSTPNVPPLFPLVLAGRITSSFLHPLEIWEGYLTTPAS